MAFLVALPNCPPVFLTDSCHMFKTRSPAPETRNCQPSQWNGCGNGQQKMAPIFTPTIFGGFLRHLMSSWQICCRQCDARGEVIEDQTLESAHSNLVPDIIVHWMDGLKIELFMVGYTKDNQCMDGWKDGLLEPCSLELVKHSGTNNQLPAPPALSAVSNHFSSPPTYFPSLENTIQDLICQWHFHFSCIWAAVLFYTFYH